MKEILFFVEEKTVEVENLKTSSASTKLEFFLHPVTLKSNLFSQFIVLESCFLLGEKKLHSLDVIRPVFESSVLIKEKIISKPTKCVLNIYDPMFLLLPFLYNEQENDSKMRPLRQILRNIENFELLFKYLSSMTRLERCFDVNNSIEDMILVKFNKSKALLWLETKYIKLHTKFKSFELLKIKNQKAEQVVESFQINNISSNDKFGTEKAVDEYEIFKSTLAYLAEHLNKVILSDLYKIISLKFSKELKDKVEGKNITDILKETTKIETVKPISQVYKKSNFNNSSTKRKLKNPIKNKTNQKNTLNSFFKKAKK